MKYLLDTNICIFLLRGQYEIGRQIDRVGSSNCCISEITEAELRYGAEKLRYNGQSKKRELLEEFLAEIEILPVSPAIRLFAKEKARLDRLGTPIDDFDILIGCSAIAFNCVMVTENLRHFNRLSDILVENWVDRELQ